MREYEIDRRLLALNGKGVLWGLTDQERQEAEDLRARRRRLMTPDKPKGATRNPEGDTRCE